MVATELPEIEALERVIELGAGWLSHRVVRTVHLPGGVNYPLHLIILGNSAPDIPAVGYFGGVHGLERIGAEVVIAYLHSLVMRLQWDSTLHRQLESVRLVFMPIVNPGGMALGTRANPNGVDLMRNAPINAAEPVPFMVGGQRISAGLPWFRGPKGAAMELENQAVCEVVNAELLTSNFSVAVDCHSGFGARDRLWFPFAHKRAPIAHLAEMQALKAILEKTLARLSTRTAPSSGALAPSLSGFCSVASTGTRMACAIRASRTALARTCVPSAMAGIRRVW